MRAPSIEASGILSVGNEVQDKLNELYELGGNQVKNKLESLGLENPDLSDDLKNKIINELTVFKAFINNNEIKGFLSGVEKLQKLIESHTSLGKITKVNLGNLNVGSLVQSFMNSGNDSLKIYAEELNNIDFDALSDEQLARLTTILHRLNTSFTGNNIKGFNNAWKDFSNLELKIKDKTVEVSEKMQNDGYFKPLWNAVFTDWDITSVDFRGKQTGNQINQRINGLKGDLLELGYTAQDIENIQGELEEAIADIEDSKEVYISTLEDVFDAMSNNIIEKDGKYYIQVDSEDDIVLSQAFSNEDEAKRAIVVMKKEAKSNFQTYFEDTKELLWTIFYEGEGIALSKANKFSSYMGEGILENIGESGSALSNGDVSGVVDLLQIAMYAYVAMAPYSILVGTHYAVGESVYRRSLDLLHMYNSKEQLEDYGDRELRFNDMGSPEAKDYAEFKQRDDFLKILREYAEIKYESGTKEYTLFMNNINKLERYKLLKGHTFYLLGNKLVSDLGIIGSTVFNLKSIFIRGGKFFLPHLTWNSDKPYKVRIKLGKLLEIEDSQQLYALSLQKLREVKEKSFSTTSIFYKDLIVSYEKDSESGRYEVKSTGDENLKTDKYNQIISYIKGLNIEDSRKITLIDRFNKLVKRTKEQPIGESTLYRRLNSILETDNLSQSELSQKIRADIVLERKKYSSLGGQIRENIGINTYSSNLRRLVIFEKLINTGQWIGSEDDFKKAISDIKTGGVMEANNIGDNHKSNAEIKGYIDDLLEKGKEYNSANNSIRKKYFNDFEGSSVEDGKVGKILKKIESYIDYDLDIRLESYVRRNFNELVDGFLDGKIIFSSELAFKKELELVLNGKIPNYKIKQDYLKYVRDTSGVEINSKLIILLDNARLIVGIDNYPLDFNNIKITDYTKSDRLNISVDKIETGTSKIEYDYDKSNLIKDFKSKIIHYKVLLALQSPKAEFSTLSTDIDNEITKIITNLRGIKVTNGQMNSIMDNVFQGESFLVNNTIDFEKLNNVISKVYANHDIIDFKHVGIDENIRVKFNELPEEGKWKIKDFAQSLDGNNDFIKMDILIGKTVNDNSGRVIGEGSTSQETTIKQTPEQDRQLSVSEKTKHIKKLKSLYERAARYAELQGNITLADALFSDRKKLSMASRAKDNFFTTFSIDRVNEELEKKLGYNTTFTDVGTLEELKNNKTIILGELKDAGVELDTGGRTIISKRKNLKNGHDVSQKAITYLSAIKDVEKVFK